MARRRFCWIQGGVAGAAVLYSIVVGAVREFWVKTAAADVKVHEIPVEIPENLEPLKTINGIVYWGPPGTNIYAVPVTVRFVPATIILTHVTRPSSWDSTVEGPETGLEKCNIYSPQGFPGVGESVSSFLVPLNFAAGFLGDVDSATVETEIDSSPAVCGNIDPAFWSIIYKVNGVEVNRDSAGAQGRGFAESAPGSTSLSFPDHGILPGDENGPFDPPDPVDPAMIPNPYESFTSALKPKVFALIKSGDGTGSNFESLAYKQLIDETVSDLGSTASGDDWRGAAVSLTPTDSITNADSCIETYLDTEDGALIDGTLYCINLDQTISGNTLRNRLQTSPDTVTATLTTQSATSGGTCTLGTATTSTVQVPSPGRGTVEGITYMP